MAVINGIAVTDDNGVTRVTWANLRNGDTGSFVQFGRFADKTVGVIVVAAGVGDVVTMEGSQTGLAADVGELHEPQGGLLSAALTGGTIKDLQVISESPLSMRPKCAGDGTTDLTVIVTMPTRGK